MNTLLQFLSPPALGSCGLTPAPPSQCFLGPSRSVPSPQGGWATVVSCSYEGFLRSLSPIAPLYVAQGPLQKTCLPSQTLLVYLFYISQIICTGLGSRWASLVAQTVKNPPAMQVTRIQSLGQKDPLEKGMATYSSILAWEIPWTEEPGVLQCMGSQTVRHTHRLKIRSQWYLVIHRVAQLPVGVCVLRTHCILLSPLVSKDKCSLEEQFICLRTVKKTSLDSQSTGFVPILATAPQRLHLRPFLGKVGRKMGNTG